MIKSFILFIAVLATGWCGLARAGGDTNLTVVANTNVTALAAMLVQLLQQQQREAHPADIATPLPKDSKLASLPQLPEPSVVNSNMVALAAAPSAMDSLDDHQKFGPGDKVMYQVIEDQDPPQTLTVTESGDLEVPYYGLVHAVGKAPRQLAGEIKGLLEKRLYYHATVILALEATDKTLMAGKVYVTGQVRLPGGFDIPAKENLTVSKAILDAGGFSDFSDKKHVRLVRKTAEGQKTFVVNVQAVWEGHVDQDVPVQPGDTVVVPARLMNY